MNTSSLYLERIKVQFSFELKRIYSYGLLKILYRLFRKLLLLSLSIFLAPVSFLMVVFGYRKLCVFVERIGHLASEPDVLLKGQKLGLIKEKKWIILAPEKKVANKHLLEYWKEYFKIYENPLVCTFLECLFYFNFSRFETKNFINNDHGRQLAYKINREWGASPPILKLSNKDIEHGEKILQKLGLPKDAEFVCVHVREEGFSKVDDYIQTHRNGYIENLIPSIKEIRSRGFWVIRLGDSSTTPLAKINGVIDYAHHKYRSARMDVFLCARAKFILGNTSGVFLLSTIFGVPAALANMIPLPVLGMTSRDISIPKLYIEKKTGKYLSFAHIMGDKLSTYRYASLYADDVLIQQNKPEDILILTKEMLDTLGEGRKLSKEEKKHQNDFKMLLNPHHYGYDASSEVCAKFLEKYKFLFP